MQYKPKTKATMATIKRVEFKKSASWYNPLFIYDGNVEVKEVKRFVFYNPSTGEELGSTPQGWFSDKEIAPFSLGIEKKIKKNLTNKTAFYMAVRDEIDNRSLAAVYIPATLVKEETKEGHAYEEGVRNLFLHRTVRFTDADGNTKEITLSEFLKTEHDENWKIREQVSLKALDFGLASYKSPGENLLCYAKAMRELGVTLDDILGNK